MSWSRFSMLGPMKAALESTLFHDRHICALWFADLSSIGIQIGGIGALAPTKRANWLNSEFERCGGDHGEPDVRIDSWHAANSHRRERIFSVKRLRIKSI